MSVTFSFSQSDLEALFYLESLCCSLTDMGQVVWVQQTNKLSSCIVVAAAFLEHYPHKRHQGLNLDRSAKSTHAFLISTQLCNANVNTN